MPSPVTGHIAAMCFPVWGHTKPLCAMLAKLVRMKRINATLFTSVPFNERVLAEVDRQFVTGEEDLRKHIRVVAKNTSPIPLKFDEFSEELIEGYKDMYEGRALAATPGGQLHEAIGAPQLVILDFFCDAVLKGIRKISARKVPIYSWESGAASAVLFLFGPENLGGNGDLEAKFEKIETTDPQARTLERLKLYERLNHELIRIPGLPPMYDHEFHPQGMAVPVEPEAFMQLNAPVHKFMNDCDGVVIASSRLYEGGCIDGWQTWFGSRPVLAVGGLSPPASAEEVQRESETPIGAEVTKFLNNALDKFGPNSVIYISFGTIFWSTEPEKIWAVIDELLNEGVPFIFSHASPVAVVPESVIAKIEQSDLACHATWVPQQTIMRHDACGWFMTHCGHNSVMESLTAGVPLICWPYAGDQPANAALLSWMHGVAYELFEVRNGNGLEPIHRLGKKKVKGTVDAVREEFRNVIRMAKGYDGDLKRSKAQWFAQEFAAAWDEDGENYKELKKIFDVVG